MYDASTDGKVTELGSLGALASYPTNVSAVFRDTASPTRKSKFFDCPNNTQVEDSVWQKFNDN